jgi:serine/threonine-protein kinase
LRRRDPPVTRPIGDSMPGPRDDTLDPDRPPRPDAALTVSDSTPPIFRGTTPASSSGVASGSFGLVQPGTDLGSRYRIESLLGEGGMGSVYKAYDRELDRLVAIKVIRPVLVADPTAAQRFKQELLLGSRVSHKHILRIHDLGEANGLKFISMAYVDGDDLHRVLRRSGRLPVDRAIALGRQIADALAAAHAEGVVHRDLKPQNILIDHSGAAYVSDFGLAKLLEGPAANVTRSGELLGTPRYMAPEQVEGGGVDHRVDLYAFGLILYEMVTGTVPFRGDSAIQELLERVRGKAPDPRTVNADTPAPLADVILRCLERNPAARFQTADEIVAALDAIGAPRSSRHSQLPLLPRRLFSPTRSRARRTLLVAPIAVMLAAVVGLSIWWTTARGRNGSGAVQPSTAPPAATATGPKHLAVLPFRVLGSADQLRYVGDGVVEALSSRLFQLPDLRVISSRDVEQARTARSIDEAARLLGASLIVEGTVQSAGDELRLVVNLHDMAAGTQTWTRQFTGTRDGLFTLQDQIYEGLVGALGASPPASAPAVAAARPTSDIDAYDAYLKGRDALRSREKPEQLEAAVDLFEQAIRQDPSFALAYAGLADASLLMYREKKDSFWAERARAAALRGRDLDERLPEVHYALGSVYSESGRSAEAVVELRRALELAPSSDEAYRRLGAAYQELGRKKDALEMLQKAVDVNPYFWLNHNVLGVGYLDFGETASALDEFRRVTDLAPQNPIGYNNIGSAYFARGEWEKGIPAYERSLKLEPHWLTYSSLGTAYFYLKRYDEAVRQFEQAAALNPNDAVTIGNLADGFRWSGQQDRARATYARAIALAYKELQVNPRDATVLAMVALYHAKSGRDDRASDLMKQARAIDPNSPALLYYATVVDTLGGRHEAALALLEKALARGYSAREAAEDPELQPLHAYEAFNRAVRRYSTSTT